PGRPATTEVAARGAVWQRASTRSRAKSPRAQVPIWYRRASFPVYARSARRPLLKLRHQRHAAKPRLRQSPHHLHYGPVLDLLVGANKDTLLGRTPASLGDSLELRDEFFDRNFGILEVDPVRGNGDRKRLLVRIEALGPGL